MCISVYCSRTRLHLSSNRCGTRTLIELDVGLSASLMRRVCSGWRLSLPYHNDLGAGVYSFCTGASPHAARSCAQSLARVLHARVSLRAAAGLCARGVGPPGPLHREEQENAGGLSTLCRVAEAARAG